MDAYLPDVSHATSFTFFWGSDSSNYWSATVTTDIDGEAFVANNWMNLAFDWSTATQTGSPNSSALNWWRLDFNFSAGQTNITKCRYDTLRVAKPETLTFYYLSWHVGTDTTGTEIFKFGATTDIPFFSGKYDHYKTAVGHQMASIYFYNARLIPFAQAEEAQATKALERARRIFPTSSTRPVKSFRPGGVNFAARNVGRWHFNNVQR